jgi:hypothetical protein
MHYNLVSRIYLASEKKGVDGKIEIEYSNHVLANSGHK